MEEEGKYNSAVSEMIQNPNHLHLDYVSAYKPKFRKIKGINDRNKLMLAHEINFLRKTFYNFEQNNSNMKKKFKPFQNEDDDRFIDKYKIFKSKVDDKYFGINDLLKNLHKKLEKKEIKMPLLNPNKNFFKKNLLLIKDEDISKFMNFKMGTKKSDGRAYKYLNNFNKILNDKLHENQEEFFRDNSQENNQNELVMNYFLEDENKKNSKILNKSESLKNLRNTNKILQDLKEVDDFITLDSENYFKLLKNKRSDKNINEKNNTIMRKTLLNKTFYRQPKNSIKTIMNKSFQTNNKDKKISFNMTQKRINKSMTMIKKENNNIYRKIKKSKDLSNNKFDESNSPKKSLFLQNSQDLTSFEKTDLIKIKKIFLNTKNRHQSIKTIDSRMSTIYPNTSYGKFFKLQKTSIKEPKDISNFFENKISKNHTKEIYETIKNSDDQIKTNDIIQNYLKEKNITEIPDLSLGNLFNDYYKMKIKLFEHDCLRNNIKLKKETSMDLESIDKLKNYFSTTHLQMDNIKKKMDNIINKVSNPVKIVLNN